MQIYRYPDRIDWPLILARPAIDFSSLEKSVKRILEDIQNEGDDAVKRYTEKFDGVYPDMLEVSENEFEKAELEVDEDLKDAIKLAVQNILSFHKAQLRDDTRIITYPGVECWQRTVPIERVGLYIPGGTAPLFSTVLMLAIPANIAGCNDIILCTPPRPDGTVHPAILYSARITGVTKVFKVGGIQAIGAMTFGTKSIPPVYKIFGPGNQYVTAAKQIVTRYGVAIDMPAGPSEVAVMADDTAEPAFVAADLLSQAEHGNDSQVLLISNNDPLVHNVMEEIEKQVDKLPRSQFVRKSLENSKIIILKEYAEMIKLVNEYAPEHLILSVKNADELAGLVVNAGSVFLGNYTPESAGDYASGTNHTLPTHGYAKVYSGVNIDSFMKKITFQKITQTGLINIGPAIMKMAEAEQLTAHKNAVSIRLK
jgi:histidinol dehydrogenase